MSKYYEYPTQVRFKSGEGIDYGIAFKNYIICAECGAFYTITNTNQIIEEYDTWVPFGEEIGE